MNRLKKSRLKEMKREIKFELLAKARREGGTIIDLKSAINCVFRRLYELGEVQKELSRIQ